MIHLFGQHINPLIQGTGHYAVHSELQRDFAREVSKIRQGCTPEEYNLRLHKLLSISSAIIKNIDNTADVPSVCINTVTGQTVFDAVPRGPVFDMFYVNVNNLVTKPNFINS